MAFFSGKKKASREASKSSKSEPPWPSSERLQLSKPAPLPEPVTWDDGIPSSEPAPLAKELPLRLPEPAPLVKIIPDRLPKLPSRSPNQDHSAVNMRPQTNESGDRESGCASERQQRTLDQTLNEEKRLKAKVDELEMALEEEKTNFHQIQNRLLRDFETKYTGLEEDFKMAMYNWSRKLDDRDMDIKALSERKQAEQQALDDKLLRMDRELGALSKERVDERDRRIVAEAQLQKEKESTQDQKLRQERALHAGTKKRLDDSDVKVQKLLQELTDREHDLEDRDNEIRELQADLSTKDAEIDDGKRFKAEFEAETSKLHRELWAKEERLAEFGLREDGIRREFEIDRDKLRAEMATMRAKQSLQVEQLRSEIYRLMEEKDSECHEFERREKSLLDQKKDRDAKIQQLEDALKGISGILSKSGISVTAGTESK